MKKLLRKIIPASVRHCVKKFICVLKIRLNIPLKKKRDKIVFEVHIAEHCNLNCRGCDNFSCIAEPKYIDVIEFERDFSRLGNIFSHECEQIFLIGGEPLLNPEIITLMKIAREHFTKGNIFVFTNGILLPKKENAFWEACHENNIGILISAYPIKIDVERIKEQADKFNVSVKWAWEQKANDRNTFIVPRVNLEGNSDIKLNFAMCGRANRCITLNHGRLFTCTFAPNVRHFNKYFNQDVKITEADYVNIYDDVSADEILAKMSEPIPACRYCDTANPGKKVQWGISKREISEWT